MGRIEDIEEPFVYRFPASAFSVVAELDEKRYSEDAELKEHVKRSTVQKDGYDLRNEAEYRDKAECRPFFPGLISVTEKEKRIQDIENRPVAKDGQNAQTDDAKYFAPFWAAAPVPEPDGQQGKEQRIDDAESRIDKRLFVFNGDRQHAEFKKTERHPREQRKNAEARRIFSDISCVLVAFRQKIGHRRPGQPADKVHDLSGNRFRWNEGPCDMVNEHSDDDQIFQLISIQRYGFQVDSPLCMLSFRVWLYAKLVGEKGSQREPFSPYYNGKPLLMYSKFSNFSEKFSKIISSYFRQTVV